MVDGSCRLPPHMFTIGCVAKESSMSQFVKLSLSVHIGEKSRGVRLCVPKTNCSGSTVICLPNREACLNVLKVSLLKTMP
jgi:hypothetical protein